MPRLRLACACAPHSLLAYSGPTGLLSFIGCCECMSLQLRMQHLEDLVVALRQEVSELRARLRPRSDRSFDLVPAASGSPANRGSARPDLGTPVRQSTQPLGSPASRRPSGVQSSATPSAPPAAAERSEACRQIGLLLRRALQGVNRGSSGRDRIQQASRFWIVVRNFEGEGFSPLSCARGSLPVLRIASEGRSSVTPCSLDFLRDRT